MTHRLLRTTTLAGLGTLMLALAACETTSTVHPAAQPPSPSVAASSQPGSGSGVFFRDDFDGNELDPSRWRSFAQTGIILVREGKLELLNTGKQANFPYVVMKENMLPKEGPFYIEWAFEYLASGQLAFALDHLPPDQPGQEILTQPFLRTVNSAGLTRFIVTHEKGSKTFNSPPDAYKEGVPHKVRLECDGMDNFRLLFDQYELGTFTSQRRPLKFWVGQFPVKDVNPTLWPRLALDYFTAAVLTTPAQAEPMPTPTPKPTPTPPPAEEPA